MPVYRLTDELVFPDPRQATPEGLLALGGDLSPARLILAYQLGIFPWYGKNEPILWWSPDPRCVLFPAQVQVSRRLQRFIKQGRYHLTCNRAFGLVIRACARVRLNLGEDTWLIPEMRIAYLRLHELGLAHSIEAWDGQDLVGGLYGVAFGKFFFGESMFHLRPNASKVILVQLCRFLQSQGFHLLDCQVPSAHLIRMGACQVSREMFLECLSKGLLQDGENLEMVTLPEVL
jgi:leucyl/phenylalanyl-tRNA--protein transferase